MRLGLVLALALTGCLKPESVPCGDHVCPMNTTCDKPTGLCVPALCGNKKPDGTEECDGDFTDEDCTDHGFYFPDGLACSPVCTIDTAQCTGSCGDHTINGPETCDGIPPAGLGCADFGFDVGYLGCSGSCTPAFNACAPIGWSPMPGGATTELRAVSGTLRTAIAVGLGGTIIQNLDGVWIPMSSPTTQDLYSVWLEPGIGVAPDTGYAVGTAGTILKFDGTTWTTMSSGVTDDLFAVSGADASTVYAAGANGTLLELAGSSWTKATSGTTTTLRGLWAGASIAFVVGDTGTMRIRGPNGTWAPVTVPFTVQSLDAITAVPSSATTATIFVAGAENASLGFVAKIDVTNAMWGNGSWSRLTMPKLDDLQYSLAAITKNDVWIAGQHGGIVHYDGSKMLRADTDTARSIFGVFAAGPARAVAVTRGGEVLGYNGTSRATQPLQRIFSGATRVMGGAIAVGPAGALLRFDGTRWASVPNATSGLPTTANLTSAYADASRVLAAAAANPAGATGGIFISTDQGATFTEVPTGSASVAGVTGAGGEYYAVGDGAIHRSTNGTSWSQVASPPAELLAVWGAPDGSTFFAVGQEGSDGTIYRGKGAAWTKMTIPLVPRLLGVWGTSTTDVYAAGYDGTVLHYDGTRWRQMYTGTGEIFASISGSSPQDIFVAGPGIRYHFDGVSWSRMSNPTFRDTNVVVAGTQETYFVGAFSGVETLARACTPTEERCDDPWDNDCDGLANCADDNCKSVNCLRGGACETGVKLECGTTIQASTYTGVARIDDLPCLDHSTPGPEASLRFFNDTAAPIHVVVTMEGGPGLDLVQLSATRGACDLQSCTQAEDNGTARSTSFTVMPAEAHYIVVDGPLYKADDFTLTVDCQ